MLTCICGASGAMDNASDYGSEDSRFDSWLARPEGSSTRDHRGMLTCTCGASGAMDNASDYGSEDSITGRFLHKGPPRDVDLYLWASGAMDNASDYGSEDSRFDSWLAQPEGSSTRDHREMLTCTCGASDAMDNASDYGSEDSRAIETCSHESFHQAVIV
ncbi:uncharacterized protein LOC109530881 isoform X5 [Hippocampus comes]|uniref:uncharacterized protein LOC109530881 isoform X5 n=1 Tax=Hippocampus comes TaxID=109280 RepID=UPI00094E80E8|nr:PREDICTED: uncharacterized protein LOC109530881 isoform X5 [Hippocampus comes]